MPTLFVSDLHLSEKRPGKLDLFYALLERAAHDAQAVYILGDLFEYWLGDDDDAAPHPAIIDALAKLTAAGPALHVMHGNRDFLMGSRFSDRTRCKLLDDLTVIALHGRRTLLMHGDLLCTRDLPYQELRRTVQDPDWQRAVLAKPLTERRALAEHMRIDSEEAKNGKQSVIMDVEQSAVEQFMLDHKLLYLIHGHTHRPARHEFTLSGETAYRFVLSDWYEGDGVLVCSEDDWQQMRVAEYLDGG